MKTKIAALLLLTAGACAPKQYVHKDESSSRFWMNAAQEQVKK